MNLVQDALPIGTNQFAYYDSPVPFNRASPFTATGLGVVKLGSGVAAPAWDAHGHMVAPSLALAGLPKAQPVNCTTQGAWVIGPVPRCDMIELLPFAVGFNGGTTAYAAVAAAEAYAFMLWAVRQGPHIRKTAEGSPAELPSYIAVPAAKITCTTGPQFVQNDVTLPSSMEASARGRFMGGLVVAEDFTLGQTVRVVGSTPGVTALLLDARGCSHFLLTPYTMPADRGFGWRHSFL
jgi:hypothetical protein